MGSQVAMSLIKGLLPDEIPEAMARFEDKLNRVIELLEIVATNQFIERGVESETIEACLGRSTGRSSARASTRR